MKMVNETSTISERTVLYNTARATLMAFATNNTSTIILMGGGGNGKSHLINECKDSISGYDIYDGELYGCERGDALEILSSPNQKIVSSLYNPYEKFDIEQPDECIIIDMNDIQF
jgi:nicotinamide riboside kinase